MQTELQINLLGSPQIQRCSQPVTDFISDKARALFYYLVITGEPHTRATLAALCWADIPEKDALRSLRQALHNLQQLFSPHLAVSRQTIAFQPEPATAVAVDLWQLLDGLAGPSDMQHTVLAQHNGALLQGFTVADAPTFDAWLHTSRATLQQQLVATAQHLLGAAGLTLRQEINVLQHLVMHEPWNEVMQRRLLTVLARQGDYAAAQQQYVELHTYLEQELGIPPEPTTTLLMERIQRAQERSTNHLPQATMPLVGRHAEVAKIQQLLTATHRENTINTPQQLITLTGPGGSGKTRLALAIAHELQQWFLDGVWWVSLAGATSAEAAIVTTARAIGVDLQGTSPIEGQIVQAIHGWDALIVLDNSEHLLSQDFRAFILRLLTAAPTLRLLLTSRERLHLQQERVIALAGLQAADEVEALFMAQARQVQPTFAPDAEDRAALLAIGRLVDGLPLALTLAAALVVAKPCTAILAALQQDLDALDSSVAMNAATSPLPHSQQSLQTVFDHSWQGLSPQGQLTFAALAHFAGDFDVEVVQAIITPLTERFSSTRQVGMPTTVTSGEATSTTGTSTTGTSRDAATANVAAQLRSLVHKSLLQSDPSRGRYVLHEVLRSYGTKKLAAEPALAQAVSQAYNRYYINFIQSRRAALLHADPTAIGAVTAEFAHIRHIWQWACATQRGEALLGMLRELGFYLDVAGRHQEGEALFQSALSLFDEVQQPLAPPQQYLRCGLLLGYSNVLERLGRYQTAATAAGEALQIGEAFNEDELIHFALLLLGRIALAQGEYPTAIDWLTQGAAFCADRSLTAQQARILLRLGEAQLACGDIAQATATFEQALLLATTTQEQRAQLYCYLGLGACALAQQDGANAQQHWQSALAQAQLLNVPTLLAETQVRIAGGMLVAGIDDKTAQLLHDALPHLADQTHSTLFAAAVRHLAWLYTIQGHRTQSELLLQRATQLAQQSNALPQQLATLLAWGRYLCAIGSQQEAAPLLTTVCAHPAATWAEQRLAGALRTATDHTDDGIIEAESAPATNLVASLLAARFDADLAHAADGILLPLLKPAAHDAIQRSIC